MDLRDKGISGSKVEYLCEKVDISLNKNSVFGDTSAINPGGVRIGSPALTTRGMNDNDFIKVGGFLVECFQLCETIQEKSGKKLVNFKITLEEDFNDEIENLKNRVNQFSEQFEFIEKFN